MGSDPAQASVTEIVTHVAQHDAIGGNMPLLRPSTFDIATSWEGERYRRSRLRT